jgi:hypothetical protein
MVLQRDVGREMCVGQLSPSQRTPLSESQLTPILYLKIDVTPLLV